MMDCDQKCPNHCETTSYSTSVSQAKWPLDTMAESFYQEIIAGKHYAWKFQKLLEKPKGNDNISDYILHLQQQELIRNNFLSVHFRMSDRMYIYYEDQPKHSILGLAAQLGASLNLWSGITMVLLIELCEALLKFAGCEKSSKKSDEVGMQRCEP